MDAFDDIQRMARRSTNSEVVGRAAACEILYDHLSRMREIERERLSAEKNHWGVMEDIERSRLSAEKRHWETLAEIARNR